MLNTSALKKNNDNTNFKNIGNETIIDEGIRKIEETADNNSLQINDNEIIKSFHSMEGRIFDNISNKNVHGNVHGNARESAHGNIHENASFKIDNFNLNEITKKYSDEEFTRSIFDNEKKLLVSISEKLNKFSIFDEKNNLIGCFTIQNIIKYLGDIYDTKQQFLKENDSRNFQKAKELIKVLIFKIKYNKKNKYSDIVMSDYTKSGFMGDIELLIKLNNQLHKYQLENMQNDLSNVDINNRIKMEQNIKKFIFILLNYTLKLISIVSEDLKNNDEKKELKANLVNYSIGIVYRINLFVQEQLKVINNQNKSVKESIDTNTQIKYKLKEKLDTLISEIQYQNKIMQKNGLKENKQNKQNGIPSSFPPNENKTIGQLTKQPIYDYSQDSNSNISAIY